MTTEMLNRSHLTEVQAIFFDTVEKRLVIECANGYVYVGEGIYNADCFGVTDYTFKNAEIISRPMVQPEPVGDNDELPF